MDIHADITNKETHTIVIVSLGMSFIIVLYSLIL